jgi:hypothetical protein
MKEIVVLTIISGFSFLCFIVSLIFGLTKKNKRLKWNALFLLVVFICLAGFTVFKFVTKSYNTMVEILKPRTGDEIYDALFGRRQTDCVKILNFQDQIIPKIDYAIWLYFETCPEELKIVLSKHEFNVKKFSTADKWNEKITYGGTEWFNPTILGDTIIIYEYSTADNRNIQTIWTNSDSTKVFVRDMLD